MLYALINDDRKCATPDLKNSLSVCPHCYESVIAKCGSLKIWHWSHQAYSSCDHEPETEWHLRWKERFPKECVEVTVGVNRADVLINDIAIEFQHSPISIDTILQRQQAYKKMAWVFDARQFNLNLRSRGEYESFRWYWPHRTLACINPVEIGLYFDFDDDSLLNIRKVHWESHIVGGWGYMLCKDEFLNSWS
jgi:hypothetical protein